MFWLILLFNLSIPAWPQPHNTWSSFGGGPDNIHYSSLKQINRSNVSKLKVAWTFDTGDMYPGSEIQCNPIVIDGVLFASTPKLRVIALDAATGKQKWSFDPSVPQTRRGKRNRGVSYWTDGKIARIFYSVSNYVYSLDAKTGKLDDGFGKGGAVDLREGLGRPVESVSISSTTPGVIYKDLLIAPTLVSESLPSSPGDIRAFDVRTGKIRWTFHTIPHPGEFGYETWPPETWKHSGGANNWSGMVVDAKRGLLYAPTGSASFDFYGADRHGDNLFANTLLCLKADTGERVWHFQAVKHDLWDRDFPSAPALVTVRRDGRKVDAVAQITKSGHVFLFDRENGEPLFPLETREVAPSTVDGESAAKTQVLPLLPPAFSRQQLTEDLLTQRTPEAHRVALERFRKIRSGPPFVPPSFEGTIVFPGFDGGGEWGGAAFDPETGLLYVNANEMAWILRIVPVAGSGVDTNGQSLYVRNCANCHREDMQGSPPQFPSLVDVGRKYTAAQLSEIIGKGVGRMPGFATLGNSALEALTAYVGKHENRTATISKSAAANRLKYTIDGYNKFLDPDGYPAIQPPWGTLTAIDLNSGKFVWRKPFGEHPELAAKGMKDTGSENYGGGVVTAGGLFFIAATNLDRKFRVFDKRTGDLLWETQLPASGNATPAMYEIKGKQYVVVAAGGGKSGAASGGSYVAFALP